MAAVTRDVGDAEAGIRLDRWFKRHYPELPHARLQRLLRTGQIRVDGKRAKAKDRLVPGQVIRAPRFAPADPERKAKPATRPGPALSWAETAELKARVLYRDRWLIALDKPAGLATQGGAKTDRHLDGMLDALTFDSDERPRLAHRLDRDTGGVLLLGRTAQATAALANAFRHKTARKLYWAVTVGAPNPRRGKIDLPLAKTPGRGGERMAPTGNGKPAITCYEVMQVAGGRAARLALLPLTGRTHQLRAHCAAIGTPILGDGKYGGAGAFLAAEDLDRKLHLHARALAIPHPQTGRILTLTAPLPDHMERTWRFFGFAQESAEDPFLGFGDVCDPLRRIRSPRAANRCSASIGM